MDEYVLWMQNNKNYSAASQKQRISALSAFLKYASGREMAALGAYNAVSGVQTPKIPRTCFPYFTPDEIKILLGMPKHTGKMGWRDAAMLSLLYDSGARAQELCDMRIGDIGLAKTPCIRLHGKGRKTREVPVSSDVAKIVKKISGRKGENPERTP